MSLVSSAFLLALTGLACSGAASTSPEEPGSDAGAPEDTTPPPPADDTAPPPPPPSDTGVDSPGQVESPVCDAATAVYTATPTPHDVLFLLDRSGSMHIKVPSGSTRWQSAEKAMFNLLDLLGSDPAIVAGLDMFPRGDKPITCCWIDPAANDVTCACATGELPTPTTRCGEPAYASALVPGAPLDDAQRAAMKDAIHKSDTEFYWGTPMKAALSSAIAKAGSGTKDSVRSVVLVTDGSPTSCNVTDDKIDATIAAAKAGTALAHPVATYVVGVIDGATGANAANLSKVALAGNTARAVGCEATNSCFYAVDAKTFEADIKKAFNDIEMKAFSCTFDVPKLSSGTPDYDLVNVTRTASGATTAVARDVAHTDGWDFLAGNTKVQLYGAACTAVKADVSTKIQVVVGCKTLAK
ncbi:MAG: hypothetical protein ABI175_11260 [Polyangiales bacterium]